MFNPRGPPSPGPSLLRAHPALRTALAARWRARGSSPRRQLMLARRSRRGGARAVTHGAVTQRDGGGGGGGGRCGGGGRELAGERGATVVARWPEGRPGRRRRQPRRWRRAASQADAGRRRVELSGLTSGRPRPRGRPRPSGTPAQQRGSAGLRGS